MKSGGCFKIFACLGCLGYKVAGILNAFCNSVIIGSVIMKKLSILLLIAGVIVAITLGLSAQPVPNPTNADPYNIITPTIMIDGVEEKLYKEYENQPLALQQITLDQADVFSRVRYKCFFLPVNSWTWSYYYNAVRGLDSEDIDNDSYFEVLRFFDIYENSDKNRQIESKVKAGDIDGLEYLLPYDSQFAVKRLGLPVTDDAE